MDNSSEENTMQHDFRDQLSHSSPFFSTNNILKFGEKIPLENILFVSKFIKRQVGLHFQEICIHMKLAGL